MPLLQELKKLVLVRNDVALGHLDEYRHDLDSGAERVAALNQELVSAMEWRSLRLPGLRLRQRK